MYQAKLDRNHQVVGDEHHRFFQHPAVASGQAAKMFSALLIFMAISFVKANNVCSYNTYSGPSGTIFSPNFPNYYTDSQYCYSYISVSTGHNVVIMFTAFNTEASNDWVTIDCQTGNPFTSGRYSGSQIPPLFTISSCSLVKVTFNTNGYDIRTGFSLAFGIKKFCETKHFSGPNGTISSPNFPNVYENNLDCYSYISVSSGHTIIITFDSFKTQSSYDWLEIACASGNNFTPRTYSGSEIPPVLTISSCSLVNVYFHTDGDRNEYGFRFNYRITSDCQNKHYFGATGTISSPNYPNVYINNIDCHSYISVSAGHTVFITFMAFRTETSYDWLEIACATGKAFTPRRYSGSELSTTNLTISFCSLVDVSFHTDGSSTYTGFTFNYNISSDCGNNYFSGSTGRISSPNFPLSYNNNLDCSSYISVPSGQAVIITFLAFNLESRCDWVAITCASGNFFTSPRYSGSQIPSVLTISSCTYVNVSFHTDGSTTNTNFMLQYNITSGNLLGGFTTKPSNVFPSSDKNDAIIFNCTTVTQYPPWWTMNAKGSDNYIITNSTCGVIASASYSSWFRTETLGAGSCNLIVVAPGNSLYLLAGTFVCTDSTLSSTRAILSPINAIHQNLKLQVLILGPLLGVAVLTIIVMLAIIVRPMLCRQPKVNTDVGNKIDGNELELRRKGVESNVYDNDSEYDNLDTAKRRLPDEPDVYQELRIKKKPRPPPKSQ